MKPVCAAPNLLSALTFTLTLACAGAAQAESDLAVTDVPPIGVAMTVAPAIIRTQPLWEIGLGAGVLRLPDYRGSDKYSGYLLPVPFVIYRGKFLRADREGARVMLLDTDRFDLDVSLSAGPPAHSDSDGIRAGMADLPGTVEIGPKVRSVFWRSASGSRLSLDLPVRAVISLEKNPRHIGTVFTPNLDLGLATGTPWRLGIQGGPMWATRSVHQHYYGVSAAEAVSSPTLERPAYQAHGGYAGWHALAGVSRRYERHWVGAYMRHDHVGGAVFDDSPLVRSRRNWSVGVAMAWVFATSEEQVSRAD